MLKCSENFFHFCYKHKKWACLSGLYIFLRHSPSLAAPTCVLKHKSIAAEGRITAESQKERVGAAFDLVWNICAIETAQQGAERVWPIIDMQEVITGLQTKPGYKRVETRMRTLCPQTHVAPVLRTPTG